MWSSCSAVDCTEGGGDSERDGEDGGEALADTFAQSSVTDGLLKIFQLFMFRSSRAAVPKRQDCSSWTDL